MKKILTALYISLSLLIFSCKKDNTPCWHCTFGIINGVQPAPQDYCGDDGGAKLFTDAQGNDLQTYCIPK